MSIAGLLYRSMSKINYNFTINQRAAVELGLVQLGINIKDLAILNFMHTWFAMGAMETLVYQDQVYFWVHYPALVDRNPLLDIQVRTLQKRLKKMVEVGLLIHHPDCLNHRLSKPYYAFGPLYSSLVAGQVGASKMTQGYVKNDAPGYVKNDAHILILEDTGTNDSLSPAIAGAVAPPSGAETQPSPKVKSTAAKKEGEEDQKLEEFREVWLSFRRGRNNGMNPPPPTSPARFKNDLRYLYNYFLAEYGKNDHERTIRVWQKFFENWLKMDEFWQKFTGITQIKNNLNALLEEASKGKKKIPVIMTVDGSKTAAELIRERYEREQAERERIEAEEDGEED